VLCALLPEKQSRSRLGFSGWRRASGQPAWARIKRPCRSRSAPCGERGDLGRSACASSAATNVLVDLQAATAGSGGGRDGGGRSLRLKVADLERQGSSGCGQPCALKPGEILQELVPLAESPA